MNDLAWAALFGIFPSLFGDALIVDGARLSRLINPKPCIAYKLRKKYRA